jgi:alkylhydroperoxidase family enzyme
MFPDDVFALVRSYFSEEELVKLTLAIVAINGANRINVAISMADNLLDD